MKLTDVVKQYGFEPSDMAQIKDAKLYERDNMDGVSEFLCCQKIGNIMRINRIALLIGQGMILPLSEPLDKVIPMAEVETYLTTTLTPAGGQR